MVKNIKWTEQELRTAASLVSSRGELQIHWPSAYRAARRLNLIDELFPGPRKQRDITWTEEKVREEALKFKSRKAFYTGNGSAYNAAKKLNILDSLFGFVRKYWDVETISEEASKYSNRLEFCRGNGSAYARALKLGMVDELFPDRAGGTDDDVIYIWKAVGHFFNDLPVYKIGITSDRLGTTRIEQVAKEMNAEFSIVCCEKMILPASSVEKKLLILGVSPGYVGINGGSEFRAMSDATLSIALGIIHENISK